jgi:hypothetical protein
VHEDWEEMAAYAAATDGMSEVVMGSVNCGAFPDLCHGDKRLALPRKVSGSLPRRALVACRALPRKVSGWVLSAAPVRQVGKRRSKRGKSGKPAGSL